MSAPLPTWIVDALDKALPAMLGGDRDALAEVILDAIPKQLVADVIRESTTSVLITRGFVDDEFRKELAFEIGNNAAASVVLSLQVGEDELDCVKPSPGWRRCARCDAELPATHPGALCPFFCIDKVLRK